ncbi:hypothetical protein [Bittarella sp. HCP28S3_D9]|uniref:hypothetical protein n=1 Tax=Bittarella sp. HCP28S3_D9 TaxID=3440253 RepID=UPI003F8C604F
MRAKENAIPLLRRELAAKRQTGVVSLGAMGDCYNPFSVLSCKYQRAGPTPGARAGGEPTLETVPAKHLLQKTRSPARLGAAYNRDL